MQRFLATVYAGRELLNYPRALIEGSVGLAGALGKKMSEQDKTDTVSYTVLVNQLLY